MLRQNNYKPFDITKTLNHEIIYQAALTRDYATLDDLCNKTCIDVLNNTYMPPVALLAEKNMQSAVEFLRIRYNSSLKWIMFGYAKGGNTVAVNRILAQETNFTELLLREVVYGYVLAGEDKIDLALDILNANPDELMLLKYFAHGWGQNGLRKSNLPVTFTYPAQFEVFFMDSLIFGYALGNHETLVNEIIDSNPTNKNSINTALRAYAICNNEDAVNRLFKKYYSEYLVLLPDIILGYALSRSLNSLNHIYINNLMPGDSFVNSLIEGFASGGHIIELETVIEQQPEEKQDDLRALAVSSLSLAGHLIHVKKLILTKVPLGVDAVAGFAFNNDFSAINDVITSNPTQLLVILNKLIALYAMVNNELFSS
jgi:hypothetical protein